MRAGGVNNMKKYKIAVAGTGYVGLSIATLLSQHHHETAVDIIPEKVEMIATSKCFSSIWIRKNLRMYWFAHRISMKKTTEVWLILLNKSR